MAEVKLQNAQRLINGSSYGSQSDFKKISEAERIWEKRKT